MASNINLNITITSRTIIKASNTSPQPYIYSLSNLDLILFRDPNAAFYIFPNPHSYPFTSIVAAVESSLPSLLNHFHPFAGHLYTNQTTKRPEIICNNSGAELLVAQANLPLATLDYHDQGRHLGAIIQPFPECIPLCVQLVGFTCGGFSLAWGSNHLLLDAYGLNFFTRSFAKLVVTGQLSHPPLLDRSFIRPRSLRRVTKSVEKTYTTCSPDNMINALAGDFFVRRQYYVAAEDIDRLRATAGGRATRTAAFSAHVWKVLGAAVEGLDTGCRMAWLVNGRKVVGGGRDMSGYMGNVLAYGVGEATTKEVREATMGEVAAMVTRAVRDVKKEAHFEELVDLVEGHAGEKMLPKVNLGMGSPVIVVSSCHHLKMEVDFGFGMPVMQTFVMNPKRLGNGFLSLSSGGKGDGSWVVQARLWPKVAAALEAGPEFLFKPLTAEHLGLGGKGGRAGLTSRM